MRSSLVTVWLVGFTLISLDTSARAGSLSGLLESPLFRRLELAPIGPALATSVASTYPVASASSSVTYVYNPALETFERQTRVAGPIIGERAETIGKGAFNFAASYHYVHLTTINGDDLDQLVNRVMVGGHLIVFPVKGGTTLKDGRYTNFLPVRVVADLDVDAHIFAPSITYGLTPDFDVNLTVPLVRTAARSLGEVLEACRGFTATIALENTAGQGTQIGWRFAQLGRLCAREAPISRTDASRTSCRCGSWPTWTWRRTSSRRASRMA